MAVTRSVVRGITLVMVALAGALLVLSTGFSGTAVPSAGTTPAPVATSVPQAPANTNWG
ncbi:hypothetical protein ACIGXM_10430 [Kitasatospora sp. NPDC052896]|uniref:hypothetical protein n=1 Tax=Kitasatospora sp. NPDC052896 TaxID=3364061 RepID=UPI0037CBF95A